MSAASAGDGGGSASMQSINPAELQSLRVGRNPSWNATGAINIPEGRKIFFAYRELLIVLLGAIPASARFLGLSMDGLLTKQGEITPEQFDKIIWLICNASICYNVNADTMGQEYDNAVTPPVQLTVERLGSTVAQTAAASTPYISSLNPDRMKPISPAFSETIGRSISTIVCRYLFAVSLNVRGIKAGAPSALSLTAPSELSLTTSGTAPDAAVISAQEAQQEFERIRQILGDVTADTWKEVFDTLKTELKPLGDRICGPFQRDVTDLERHVSSRGDRADRSLPTRLAGICRSLRDSIGQYVKSLEHAEFQAEKQKKLQESLAKSLEGAANLFDGVTPIPNLKFDDGFSVSVDFSKELVEKYAVMSANLPQIIQEAVVVQESPSLQACLTRIGLLENKAVKAVVAKTKKSSSSGSGGGGGGGGGGSGGPASAAGDGDGDDESGGGDPRLRSLIESLSASVQCDHAVGRLREIPDNRCYICQGLANTGVTMECEHIFCIGLAIEYFGLLRTTDLDAGQKLFLSILYAWAHRCCNRLKSNMSFMKINPNYIASRGNFFMFHDLNASTLLRNIWNNRVSHDCASIFNRNKMTPQQFIATRIVGISQKVKPLVHFSNVIFTTWYAASTVLLTAMGCLKNMACLLVSLNGTVRQAGTDQLDFNVDRMKTGFDLICGGRVQHAGMGGGGKIRKNRGRVQKGGVFGDDVNDVLSMLLLNSEEIRIRADVERLGAAAFIDNPPAGGGAAAVPTSMQSLNFVRTSPPSPERNNVLLFKLASIANGLNFESLYNRLLLRSVDHPDDAGDQTTILRTFKASCESFLRNVRGPETIEDASLLMLHYISIGEISRVNKLIDSCERKFGEFMSKVKAVFDTCSSTGLLVLSRQGHTSEQQQEYNSQREKFLHLCVLRPSSLETCHGNAFTLGVSGVQTVEVHFLAELMLEFDGIVMGHSYTPPFPRTENFEKYCRIKRLVDLSDATKLDNACHWVKAAAAEAAAEAVAAIEQRCSMILDYRNDKIQKEQLECVRVIGAEFESKSKFDTSSPLAATMRWPQLERDSLLEDSPPTPTTTSSPESSQQYNTRRLDLDLQFEPQNLFNMLKHEYGIQQQQQQQPQQQPQHQTTAAAATSESSPPSKYPKWDTSSPPMRTQSAPASFSSLPSDMNLGGGRTSSKSTRTRHRRLRRNHRRTQYTNKHKRSSKSTKHATIKRRKSYRKHKHTVKRRKSRRHR